jgi:hypothetical protein
VQDLGDAEQMSEIGADVAFEAQGSDQAAQGDLALLAVPDRLAAFDLVQLPQATADANRSGAEGTRLHAEQVLWPDGLQVVENRLVRTPPSLSFFDVYGEPEGSKADGIPNGIRTRVAALKGRSPDH